MLFLTAVFVKLLTTALKELNFPFVLYGGFPSIECSQVSALARFWIFFSRVEAISA